MHDIKNSVSLPHLSLAAVFHEKIDLKINFKAEFKKLTLFFDDISSFPVKFSFILDTLKLLSLINDT